MIEIIQTANAGAIAMIAVVVALVTWAVKQTKLDNRWLPLIDMVVGFLIGVVAFYAMPGQFETLLIAGLDGAIAGLVSAGGYDAVKSILGGQK
ncbi:phage holin family protein [Latilactobacillus sakei]